MKTHLKKGIISATLLFVPFVWAKEPTIQINDPWIREAPPNVPVLAAYMIINNPSEQPVTLTTITSTDFEDIEIHQTVNHGNMMKMEHLPQLVIKAKSQVELAPGGYHLMLMNPEKTLSVGDNVDLTMTFTEETDEGKITITAPVRKFQLAKE